MFRSVMTADPTFSAERRGSPIVADQPQEPTGGYRTGRDQSASMLDILQPGSGWACASEVSLGSKSAVGAARREGRFTLNSGSVGASEIGLLGATSEHCPLDRHISKRGAQLIRGRFPRPEARRLAPGPAPRRR